MKNTRYNYRTFVKTILRAVLILIMSLSISIMTPWLSITGYAGGFDKQTMEEMRDIRDQMKEILLKPNGKHDKVRYEHCIGVGYTCACLAMAHGYDMDKAWLAGQLHDCAKNLDADEAVRYCEEHGYIPTEEDMKNSDILHAKNGKFMAMDVFNITDEDILDAIWWHTTGRPGMTMLEKILYVADYIEPDRAAKKRDNVEEIRGIAFHDLDLAVYLKTEAEFKSISGEVIDVDETSIATYYYYKALITWREENITPPTQKIYLTCTKEAQELIDPDTVPQGVNIEYSVNNDAEHAPEDHWEKSIPAATDAGKYYIWCRLIDENGERYGDMVCLYTTIADNGLFE